MNKLLVCSQCSCVVVNVEYRLSPEHKFPACYTDAEAVVRWALDNKQELANNSSAIVGVAGDSAGGNIAATVCHLVEGLSYQVNLKADPQVEIEPTLSVLTARDLPI